MYMPNVYMPRYVKCQMYLYYVKCQMYVCYVKCQTRPFLGKALLLYLMIFGKKLDVLVNTFLL